MELIRAQHINEIKCTSIKILPFCSSFKLFNWIVRCVHTRKRVGPWYTIDFVVPFFFSSLHVTVLRYFDWISAIALEPFRQFHFSTYKKLRSWTKHTNAFYFWPLKMRERKKVNWLQSHWIHCTEPNKGMCLIASSIVFENRIRSHQPTKFETECFPISTRLLKTTSWEWIEFSTK